ncbi:MAG: glycosyltransferase [Prevotella sp.]|nr:glycosyltransferase [Prevotella sp.]
MSINQSIIMPYHRNKSMLQYTTAQIEKIVDTDVEIIVIGNNNNAEELDVKLSPRIKFIKIEESMLYSRTVNLGVDIAKGDIITLCDQDIFSFSDWYTPLIKKLQDNRKIGAVSSKLINPSNNRIIDFGIEYSHKRIVHTLRGHKSNYPLALYDRPVTSSTSAILTTYKSLYQKIGGMDIDMPYCCSDCDIGFKIFANGYENWVVADSIAFHRGSSSEFNGKKQSFEYLREESHIMFWRKNANNPLLPTVGRDIKNSVDYILKCGIIKPLYTFINLSSFSEYEWYKDEFVKYSGSDVSDIHTYKSGQSNYRNTIQIYDVIPYYFMNYTTPLVYFVDYFPSLKENEIWKNMRNTQYDLVFDASGNIVPLDDIINGFC